MNEEIEAQKQAIFKYLGDAIEAIGSLQVTIKAAQKKASEEQADKLNSLFWELDGSKIEVAAIKSRMQEKINKTF